MESVRLRASSIGRMLDCPLGWEAQYLRGLRLPTSPAAKLGTSVHAGAAVFDSARLNGTPISIDSAATVTVATLNDTEEEVEWGDESKQQVEDAALAALKMYCENIAPLMKYCGVEVQCEDLVIKDYGITLTGTTDRVTVDDEGNIGIADIKTGKTIVSADGTVNVGSHALQLGVYELLVETAMQRPVTAPAQVIGLQIAKTDKGRRAAVASVEGAKYMLLGEEGVPGLLDHVSHILKSGLFHPNPKSSLCHPKFCPIYGTCKYHK